MPKRGENIYKRKDGRWEGRYIRGRTASGQAEYGYVYADSYKACRAKRQQCIETLPEKPAVQASAATLAQAAELFLSEKSHVLKASSWNRYSYLTQHYILPALGTAPICQMTADQISDFLRRLQRSGLSGKSARDIGVLLKSILKYTAKKLDCICPGVNAELPVYRRKKIEVFFADEIGRLAKKVLEAPSMAGVGVLLALNAGLRLGELCALQYKDIDLCNGVIHITKTAQRMKKGMHTHLVVQPPKTDSARRTIPLPEDMLALLRQTVCPARNEENYFLTGKSAPLEPRTLQYQYRTLLKAAGIPYRNFHVLRHPYVKHTTKIFSLRLMDFQAQAYPDARRKTRGACQLHRGGQSRSPVRPLCNRKRFSCLPPQSKISRILYAISMRLSGYTSTRSISSSASSVVSVSASKIALDASLRLSCRACSSCFCFACANTAA